MENKSKSKEKMEKAKSSIVKLSAFYIKKIDLFAKKKVKEREFQEIQKEYKVINELKDKVKEKEEKEKVKLMPKENPPNQTQGQELLKYLTAFRIKLTDILKNDLKPEKKEELRKMPTLEEALKFGINPEDYDDMEDYIAEEIEKDPEMGQLLDIDKQREELEKEKIQLEKEKEKNKELEVERKVIEEEKKKLEVEKEKQKEIEKERERLKKEMEKLKKEREMMMKLVEERKMMEEERKKMEAERQKQQEIDQKRMKELEEESKKMDLQLKEERKKVEEERKKREELEAERMQIELERNKIEEEILKKALENSKKKLEEEKKKKEEAQIKKDIEDEKKKIDEEKEKLAQRRVTLNSGGISDISSLKELAESRIESSKVLEDEPTENNLEQSQVLRDKKKSLRQSVLIQGDLKKQLAETLQAFEQTVNEGSIAEASVEEEDEDSETESYSKNSKNKTSDYGLIEGRRDSNLNNRKNNRSQSNDKEIKGIGGGNIGRGRGSLNRRPSHYGSFLGDNLNSERPSIFLTTTPAQNDTISDKESSVESMKLMNELREERRRLEEERRQLEEEKRKIAEKELNLKVDKEKAKIEEERRKLELEKSMFEKEKNLSNRHSEILTEKERLELEKSIFEKERDLFYSGDLIQTPEVHHSNQEPPNPEKKEKLGKKNYNSNRPQIENDGKINEPPSRRRANSPKKGKKKQYSSVKQAEEIKERRKKLKESESILSKGTRTKSKNKRIPKTKSKKTKSPIKKTKKNSTKKPSPKFNSSTKRSYEEDDEEKTNNKTPLFEDSVITGLVNTQENEESFTKRKSMFESQTSHSSLGLNNLNIDDDSVLSDHNNTETELEKTKSLISKIPTKTPYNTKEDEKNYTTEPKKNDEILDQGEEEYATFGTNKPDKEEQKGYRSKFSDTDASELTLEKGNIIGNMSGIEDSVVSGFHDFDLKNNFDSLENDKKNEEEDEVNKQLRMLSFHLNKVYQKNNPKVPKPKLLEILHNLALYCKKISENKVKKNFEKNNEKISNKKIDKLRYLKKSDLERPKILKAKLRAAQDEEKIDKTRLIIETLSLFLQKMLNRRKEKKKKKYLKRNLRRMARQIYKTGKKALRRERKKKKLEKSYNSNNYDQTLKNTFDKESRTHRSKSPKLDKTKNIFDTSNNISAIPPVLEVQDKTHSLTYSPSKDTIFSKKNTTRKSPLLNEEGTFEEREMILKELRDKSPDYTRKLNDSKSGRNYSGYSNFEGNSITGIDPTESRFIEVGELTVGDDKDMDPENQNMSKLSMKKLSLERFKAKMNKYEEE